MSVRIKRIVAAAILLAACISPAAFAVEGWKVDSWWHLPEGVCSYDKDIDALFNFIVVLTGIVFIGTEALLILFIIKYRHREGQKAFYSHGSHKLEMIWTITPAITLIVIALIQARTWNQIKAELPDHDKSIRVQIFAKQFSWFFRYPDEKGKFGAKDEKGNDIPNKRCVYMEKELVVPVNTPVILEMTSDDVIHSFFVPYMRLKQDLVPGMMIMAWFDASKTTKQMREEGRPKMTLTNPKGEPKMVEWNYPIACAELCGLNHFQMAGKVTVLEKPEFDAWIKTQRAEFSADPPVHADGTDALPPEIFEKSWQITTNAAGLEGRKYGGSNLRTKLAVYKAAVHKAEAAPKEAPKVEK